MGVNKVIYGGNTLVDLTGDTVTAADLADGVKATNAAGEPIVGLMQKVTIDNELSSTSTNPVQNKVINAALNSKADSSVLSAYLPLAGGACTGGVSAPNFQTGTGATNYFQCRKFRGEGDSNSYYHAIDFGYSGHDSVDFYEYDPNWNFYSCTTGTKSGAVLVGKINGSGWNGGAVLSGTPTAPTAATGTNTTQIATTAFVQNSLGSYVKTVNNTAPDENGNVTIAIGGGSPSIIVDAELSTTSTNAIQNKAVATKFDEFGAAWGQALAAKADTADLATVATSGDYNDLTNKPTVVKSVNNVFPDGNGNVNISTSSGGGVSLSTENTWTAKQAFQKMKFNFESFATSRISGTYDSPATSVAVYSVTGAFTLDMSTLAGMLANGEATLFTAYIVSNASYALSITNAGTLKYVGSATDLAITNSGLLLNVLLTKKDSGVVTTIVQASKLV